MNPALQAPEIFRGAKEYRYDPRALELAQATFNEEGLYLAICAAARDWHGRAQRPARVLDVCAATGLTALRVARAIPVAHSALVDTDALALVQAERQLKGVSAVTVYCEDAVLFCEGAPYDLILMNSAYHHVEDDRKVAFLSNAASLLADGGRIVLGEHFLPVYAGLSDYREAVTAFYVSLLRELQRRGESADAIDVIRRSGLYGWERNYEFKVSWDVFEKHVASADLKLLSRISVWLPHPEVMERIIGTIVVVLKRGQDKDSGQ